MHRRMVRRETRRRLVVGQFGQSQRYGMADQLTEQPVAAGQIPDPGPSLVVHAHRDELRQALLPADHPQRAVLRVDQHHGRLDDVPQHLGQIQLPPDGQDRLQQTVHPVPGAAHRVDADLQLLQQLVEAQPRYPFFRTGRRTARVRHRGASTPSGSSLYA